MTVARTPRSSLAGVRIGLLADTGAEVAALEDALIREGAVIERMHPDAAWWRSDIEVDLIIVRLRGEAGASQRQPAGQRRFELIQTLAHRERIIALLDQPPEGELGRLCEFALAPFRPEEVIPRVFRVLQEPHPSASVRVGNGELNIANRTLTIEGQPVDLTYAEFEIFRTLLNANGGALSREELNRRLGGDDAGIKSRRIDIHIHRLRSKLQRLDGAGVETIRNFGYRLNLRRSGER